MHKTTMDLKEFLTSEQIELVFQCKNDSLEIYRRVMLPNALEITRRTGRNVDLFNLAHTCAFIATYVADVPEKK